MDYPEEFEKVWKMMPKRDANNPKKAAFKAWRARVREGVKPADLERAAGNYWLYCRQKGILNTDLVMMGATFLGPNERWDAFKGPLSVGGTSDPPPALKLPPAVPEERIDARPFISELLKTLAMAKRSPLAAYSRAK